MWAEPASTCKNPDAAADLGLATSWGPLTDVRRVSHGQIGWVQLGHLDLIAAFERPSFHLHETAFPFNGLVSPMKVTQRRYWGTLFFVFGSSIQPKRRPLICCLQEAFTGIAYDLPPTRQ